ncbi:MAG: hypothetical protein ACREUR_09175 [Nitrosospira sp.]
MRHIPALKSSAARSAILASIILGAASLSYAQTTSAAEQEGASAAKQGWGDAKDQSSSSQKGSSTQGAPDQAGPPSGWSSAGQVPRSGSESCRYSTPEEETFLCKFIRIFYGPDTPRGPNPDVENNISAGGAGG